MEPDLSPSLPPKDGTHEPAYLAPELGSRPQRETGRRPWWRSLKGPIAVLLTDLNDPTPMVRRRAAEALARLGDRRAISALVIGARDKRWEVRQACVKALDRLGGDGVLAALHRASKDGHAVVRLAAAEAIGRHGNGTSVPVLRGMLDYAEKYGTPGDRLVIAEALRQVEARLDA